MRDTIQFGFKIALYCQARNGHVLATPSALMPLGILPDDPTKDPPPFERAVFVIAPAEGKHRSTGGEELKFGQVIRLIHDSSDRVVTCSESKHALIDKAHQRVTLERSTADSSPPGDSERGSSGQKDVSGGGGTSSPGGRQSGGGASAAAGGGRAGNAIQKFDRWRVLPRYRVRAEGERVRDQDHVILQAASGENLFLHVSKAYDNDMYHELNCGPISEGFGMMIYDKDVAERTTSTGEEKALRGGSCIMLYHKEEKGYVFADLVNKTCVLDPYDDPIAGASKAFSSAPLNAKMMFIIEFEERRHGGIVTSGSKQLFRLKALSNNMYLCVRAKGEKVTEKGHKDGASEMGGSIYSGGVQAPTVTVSEHPVTLTADSTNAGTLFAFHQAADDQGPNLHNRSRIFVEAPEVDEHGVWFSVGGKVTTKRAAEAAVAGAPARKSDRPKKKLVFQDIQNMKDGVEVQRVPRASYATLINVLALLPPLEAFATQAGAADEIPNYHLLTQAIENLAALRTFCFVGDNHLPEDQRQLSNDEILKGTVDKEGQRRLLDQGVVSLALLIAKNITLNKNVVLDLLGSTDAVGGDDKDGKSSKNDAVITVKYADIQEVLSLCFGLVQDIVRSSPYNSAAIVSELEFIVQSVKKIPSALDCLMECFRDNPAVVDTGEDLKTLKFLVNWFIEAGRDERILEVLTLLVECEGVRLTAAQNCVCEMLLRKREVAACLFAPFTSQGGAQVGVASWYLSTQRGAGGSNPLSGSLASRPSFSAGASTSLNNPSSSMMAGSVGPSFNPTLSDLAGAQMIMLTKLNEVILTTNSSAAQQRMERFIRYVSKQLLFFAGLCAGQNSAAIAIVHQLVPVEIILPIMMSESVHVSIRAAFVKLFNNSVVDVEGSIDLTEHVRSIRHVIDDPVNSDAYNVEHEVSEMLGNSKKFALSFLKKTNGRMDPSQRDHLQMTDSALRLLTALIQRGMFSLIEYTELIWLLSSVLDTRNDSLPKFMSDSAVAGGGQQASAILDLRFRVSEEIRPMINTKLRAFKCIGILVELVLTQHVATVVNGFVRGRSIGHVTQLVDIDPFSKISAFSFGAFNRRKHLSDAANALTNDLEKIIAIEKAERDLVASPLGGLLEDGPLLPILSNLVGVLMTVSQYQDSRMRKSAIELFCILSNFPGEVLVKCRRVQLLTSHASAGYYNNIKAVAIELERCSGVSGILNSDNAGKALLAAGPPPTLTMDRMQTAAACLERLEFYSAQKDGGAMIEKIAMMRHVGIPRILTVLMSAVPTPPREEYRKFVFSCVALLKTLAEDELICEMLCELCSEFTHLTSHDMDILGLLRVLYINRSTEQTISADTIKQVVSCITFSHSSIPAVQLLQDLLQKVDSKGKYNTRNQVLVWRTLIADTGVLKIIKLRRQWTGKRGRPMRDSLLASREYFNPAGNLRLHLELVKLLYLISKFNDSVRAEEIRFEIFGVNAIEDLMEVVTNAKLPAFFRNAYLLLLEVIIIDDKEGFQSLINHRRLPDLIEICQTDVETLASLCSTFESWVSAKYVAAAQAERDMIYGGGGASNPFSAFADERATGGGGGQFNSINNSAFNSSHHPQPTGNYNQSPSRQSQQFDDSASMAGGPTSYPFATDPKVKVCVPDNELERAVEERRSGLAFFSDHITLAVLPALKHLVTRVLLERSSRVSVYMKGAIVSTINDLIDSVCELTRLVFVVSVRPYTDYPGFGDNEQCRRRLRAFLKEAVRLDCKGTDEWSDDVNLLSLVIPTTAGNANGGDGGDADEEIAGAKDEKALTSRWLDYLHTQLDVNCEAVKHENAFATAAGIILRSGPLGSKFAATLVKGLDEVNESYQLACLNVIRQIAALTPLHLHDDSVMLSFDPTVLLVSGSGGSSVNASSLSPGDLAALKKDLVTTVGAANNSYSVRLLGIGALTAVGIEQGPVVASASQTKAGGGGNAGTGADGGGTLLDIANQNIAGNGAAIAISPGADKPVTGSVVNPSITNNQATMMVRITSAVTNATECVQLTQALRARQDIMSRWGKTYNDQVLPTIISLLSSEDPEVVIAGAECANMLLDGGNKRMQAIFYNWVSLRSDEEVFLVLRRRLSACRDSMRYYAHLRKRDVDPGNTLELLPLYLLLLRFVQLLCEGHNDDLQRYLRLQPDNQVTVNVLECLEGVLEIAATCVDAKTVSFIQQLLATISETIQGPCKTNQDMFVSTGIADHLVHILSLPATIEGCDPQDVQRVRLLGMTTLLSLLEGRSEVSFISSAIASLELRLLGKAMDRSLKEYEEAHGELVEDDPDHSALRQWCARFWSGDKGKTGNTEPTLKDEMTDELNVGTSVFILFKSCLDLEHLHGIEFADREGSSLKQILRHTSSFRAINKRVAMIELIRGGVLERAYFRIPMLCKENLKEDSRQQLINEVSRDSDNDRLQDYFERCMKLIDEVEFYGSLRAIPIFHAIHENITVVESVAIFFAFAANITMISTFKIDESVYVDAIPGAADIVLLVFGVICAALQLLLLLHFCIGSATVMLNDYWTQQLDDLNQKAVQEAREHLSIDQPQIIRDIKSVVPFPSRVFQSAQHLLNNSLCWRRVCFCAAAFLGVFHSTVWYSFLIMQITVKNRLLINCVYAITKNGPSLLITCFLLICVAYVFATIAYENYTSYFDPYGDGGAGIHCRNLAHCTLLHIVYGLMQGGMHDLSSPADPQPHFAEGWGKLFYDFFYFIVVTVLIMNIVTGIIIDTFAELREQRAFVESDQEQKCFICGIEQNNFDKIAPGSFKHHVQFEHNMWHYLYFFHYIHLKHIEDLNGQEQHIFHKVTQKDLSFFPVGKAMMLDHNDSASGSRGSDEISRLGGTVQEERMLTLVAATIKRELAAVEEKIERVAERLGMSGEELDGVADMGGNPGENSSRRSGGGGSAKGGSTGGGGGSGNGSPSGGGDDQPNGSGSPTGGSGVTFGDNPLGSMRRDPSALARRPSESLSAGAAVPRPRTGVSFALPSDEKE